MNLHKKFYLKYIVVKTLECELDIGIRNLQSERFNAGFRNVYFSCIKFVFDDCFKGVYMGRNFFCFVYSLFVFLYRELFELCYRLSMIGDCLGDNAY